MKVSESTPEQLVEKAKKVKATAKVNNAVQRGAIKKGACDVCGSTGKVWALIKYYDLDRCFDELRWLCMPHHLEAKPRQHKSYI